MISTFKVKYGIDTLIPLKKNMDAYLDAKGLGACPRTNIFKLEPQYTVSNSRLLYCMLYVKNLDSYSRTSS